jgi:F0F1-type ATP synthase membrane subunit b/b'
LERLLGAKGDLTVAIGAAERETLARLSEDEEALSRQLEAARGEAARAISAARLEAERLLAEARRDAEREVERLRAAAAEELDRAAAQGAAALAVEIAELRRRAGAHLEEAMACAVSAVLGREP